MKNFINLLLILFCIVALMKIAFKILMRKRVKIRPTKEEILYCIGPDWIALRKIKMTLIDKYTREYQYNLNKNGHHKKKIKFIWISLGDIVYLSDELVEEGYLEKRDTTTSASESKYNKEGITYEYRRTGKLYKIKNKKREVLLPVPI